MPWLYLLFAGLLEVTWAVGLKWAVRHPRYWPLLLVFAVSVASFLLLARAMRDLPLGTSYVIWTGIGAAGAAAFGIVLFNESTDPWRVACMALIVVGVLGLKYHTANQQHATSLQAVSPSAWPVDK